MRSLIFRALVRRDRAVVHQVVDGLQLGALDRRFELVLGRPEVRRQVAGAGAVYVASR